MPEAGASNNGGVEKQAFF